MSDEDTGFAAVGHGASIPDSQSLVIGARVQDVWGRFIAEAHGIDVVFMIGELED